MSQWNQISSIATSAWSRLTCFAIDKNCSLIWTGHEDGLVQSFEKPLFFRYTAFDANNNGSAILGLISVNTGVVIIDHQNVYLYDRNGMLVRDCSLNSLDATSVAFCNASKATDDFIITGSSHALVRISPNELKVLNQSDDTACQYINLRCGQYLCCASDSGEIDIRNPDSLEKVFTIKAHVGHISYMDTQSTWLATCGYSYRRGSCVIDPLVKLYDLRNQGKLIPITYPSGPISLLIHPRSLHHIIVASQAGQISIVNSLDPTGTSHFQVMLGEYVEDLKISSTGDELYILDSTGKIQLWSVLDLARLTTNAQSTDIYRPDANSWRFDLPESVASFNAIGLPFYKEPLLSLLPSDYTFEVLTGPIKIHPSYLASAKKYNGLSIAPNMLKLKAFTISRDRLTGEAIEKDVSRLRSEMKRSGLAQSFYEDDEKNESTEKHIIPRAYKPFIIKVGKFGIEDFNFQYYNKTDYPGIEPSEVPFLNAIVQLLNSLEIFRDLAINHSISNCNRHICLLCELGFFFQMLKDCDKGYSTHTSNLCRALKSHPDMRALFSKKSMNKELTSEISCKFLGGLLDIISREDPTIPMKAIFGNLVETQHKCSCGYSRSFFNPLEFPEPSISSSAIGGPDQIFTTAVKNSLLSSQICPVEHDTAAKGKHLSYVTRKVHSLGKCIIFQTYPLFQSDKWADKISPTKYLSIIQDSGHVSVFASNEEPTPEISKFEKRVYKLRGMVCHIRDLEKVDQFVALVSDNEDSCFLFNDFLVKQMDNNEMYAIPEIWKLPVLLLYENVDQSLEVKFKDMDLSLLFNGDSTKGCKYLDRNSERPSPEMKVAIDTEFVALEPELSERRSDGTFIVIRPVRLSLARISMLRVNDSDIPQAFVDDYVETHERVYDYLTEFSGIHSGDLDPKRSQYSLVSLKSAYKKLRLLVTMGCKFIGHGLAKDFRIMNIIVPSNQIIDTVDLFYLSSWQRKLSLRYLVWYLLNEDIQMIEHDSIEDAFSAMRLYFCYEKLKQRNILDQTLLSIYRDGKNLNFKPGDTKISHSKEQVEDTRA